MFTKKEILDQLRSGDISDELLASTHLDLSDMDLSDLPESIGKLANLAFLDLWKNNLTSLPEAIGKLPKLKELILRWNPLVAIPFIPNCEIRT